MLLRWRDGLSRQYAAAAGQPPAVRPGWVQQMTVLLVDTQRRRHGTVHGMPADAAVTLTTLRVRVAGGLSLVASSVAAQGPE